MFCDIISVPNKTEYFTFVSAMCFYFDKNAVALFLYALMNVYKVLFGDSRARVFDAPVLLAHFLLKTQEVIMKLMIAGSRGINNFDLTPHIPENTDCIISGGASGVDTLAEKYADKNRLSKIILRPRYDLYKKAAPLKRNDEMVNIDDSILVVWDGISKGTKHTIDYAKKLNKKINVIIVEN